MGRTINKYAVVTVYNEGDGAKPLAHLEDVFERISDAKKCARDVAKDMLATYNNGMDKENQLKFKDAWEQVDNREEDEFLDWGYDPIDGMICWRVRVVWYPEEET